MDDSTASMEGDGDTEDGDKAPLTSANDPMLPQADQQPMIVLRFLDELWPEPVALKVAMKHLAAGVNTAHVEWPQRTQSLFQSVSNILKELESYQQLSSRFHKVPPEVVASSLEEGDRAYQYAKCIEQNVPIRVLALWMGMKEYWGGEPNRSSERAMRNYLALANFKIQLELSRYLKGISPAEFRAIAEGLEIWFPLDERHLYAKFFSFAEPVYSADVYYVADLNVNRYMFGPKSQIVSAYFDYSVNHRPITNGWFAEHLIPQVEFFISSRYSNSAAATCVQYREEAKINKIRDEDFEEVAYDPRGRNSKLNPA